MTKERKINWNAAFEIPNQPEKFVGPGGGKRYKVEVITLVSHAGKEKELKVHAQSKGKEETSRKAWQGTLVEIIRFIQSNLKKPLTPAEANLIGDKFAELFYQDAGKADKMNEQ